MMNRLFQNRRIFLLVMVVALAPAIYAAYDLHSVPFFAFGLLIWWALPVGIAYLVFHFRRHDPAWGWLVAVLLHGYFIVVSVRQSESSTASLEFLWAPLVSIIVVGPAGALVGALLSRSRRSRE